MKLFIAVPLSLRNRLRRRSYAAPTLIFIMRSGFFYLLIVLVSSQLAFAKKGNGQSVEDVRVTLELKNSTLESAFKKIEGLTDFLFAYQPKHIEPYSNISLPKGRRSVSETLNIILEKTDLLFRQVDKNIIIYRKQTISSPGSPEAPPPAILNGVVKNVQGKPVSGVNIIVKGTSIGTTTDDNGKFTLTVADETNIVLEISAIGYKTETYTVGAETSLVITLQNTAVGLDDVVVVGYGKQKKVNLTGAVVAIGAKDIENRAAADISGILTGQAPGLTIIQSGGNPGRNTGTLNIRGIGTLNNTDPLIIVDGIPTGSLTDINPEDVASVSILKDAASSSIYGVRAANGVVLITTKRGKINGANKITFSHQTGFTELISFPRKVDAAALATLHNQANTNDGTPLLFSAADITKFKDGSSPLTHANTDVIDLLFSKGVWNNENLAFSGGTEKGAYNISLGYLNEGGIINQTGLKKYSVRANLDSKISSRLNVGLNIAGTLSRIDDPGAGINWITHTAFREWATDALQFPDGRWANPSWSGLEHNSLAYSSDEMGKSKTNNTRLIATGFAEYEIIKGLKAKGIVSVLHDFNKTSSLIRGVDLYRINTTTGIIDENPSSTMVNLQKGSPLVDMVSRNYFDNNEMNYQFLITYEHTIGNHFVSGLFGTEDREQSSEYSFLSRRKLLSDALDQINSADPAEDNTGGNTIDFRLRSVFGRINYSYDERYLFEANIRYDGSSRFSKDLRYDYFPSVSVGWRISKEQFFDVPAITDLKIRASWGKLGNQEVGDYRYLSTYVLNGSYFFNNQQVSGITEGPLANALLTWEKTTSKNIGLDVGLFKNKLTVSADYFIRNTDDILLAVPQPAILGAPGPVINAGSVRNKGFEIDAGYRDRAGQVGYTIRANIGQVKNEITSLAGTDRPGFRTGDPIQNQFGYKAEGLFQTQEEITKHADQTALGIPKPGDIKYADLNNDGKINADDRMNLGSRFPGVNYGASIGADYKGFDISMVWQGVADAKVLGAGRFIQPFWLGSSPLKYQMDSWTPDHTNAKYPKVSFTNSANYLPSSFWLQDAAYLKLRNLQVGYTLSNSVVSRWKLTRARIYVSAENLLTITSFDYGFDPEDVSGGDPVSLFNSGAGNYPTTKRFLAGFTLTF